MAWFKRNVLVLLTAALLIASAVLTAINVHPGGSQVFVNRKDAVQEQAASWEEAKDLNRYDLSLDFDPDGKKLAGTLRFDYTNTEDRPMGELHFLLYPNSFASEAYGVFREDFASAYPNGFSPGGVEITTVVADDSPKGGAKTGSGQALDWVITGDQRQVLQVKLPKSLPPGEHATITIGYAVTIPNCYGRFGYGADTFSLVNCHPILSVYEDHEWHDYPYYEMGDPFYSEVADYHAVIHAPKEYAVAATGTLTHEPDGSWEVDAPARRDFGFVASNRFRVESTEVNGTLVRSYYLTGDEEGGRQALSTAAEAIELYDALFGGYPYAEFSVVQADFFIGGMEYPGMVLIDSTCYKGLSNRPILDLIVAHETAHQWWYATVGDDEVMNPWLDEGLTEFTTQLFFKKCRNRVYQEVYQQQIDYLAGYRQQNTDTNDDRADLPSYAYDNSTSYSAWVYDRTAAVLKDLRAEIGDDAFFAGLARYYRENRLKVATPADFENAMEAESGRDLTAWFTDELGKTG